jgi:4-amino-4-deoxy-L-arabinose transferase-like glycosyltransferase
MPLLVMCGAALVYLPQLGEAPGYLNRDEVFIGLTAHSSASTGRDTVGRFLPLYFQMPMRYGSEMWFQPIPMYAATLSVKLFGLTEGTIRLPMALAGIADVTLVYCIGRLIFGGTLLPIAAALLLAVTPAHLINSRVAMDYHAPLPFMLVWLLCLLSYLRQGRLLLLFAGGLALGIGIYTYIAAYILMPIYASLTCGVLWQRREPLKHYWILAAGFLLPALCCLPFVLSHPTVLHDVFWHYQRDKPQTSGALDLFGGFFTYERFTTAASVYAGFWNPRLLFINGPHSMWAAGAFLLPAAGLLAVGVVRALRRPVPHGVLLVGGLLTAPIPASLAGEGEAVHRAAAVLPFGVLLAILGLHYLMSTDSPRGRGVGFVAVWAVVIGVAVMFHAQLALGQAYVRAATVPLAVAGLAMLLRQCPVDQLRSGHLPAVALVTLVSIQAAYLALGYETVALASAVLLGAGAFVMRDDTTAGRAISAWTAIQRHTRILYPFRRLEASPIEVLGARRAPMKDGQAAKGVAFHGISKAGGLGRLGAVLLAAASSHFLYAYADYSGIHRVVFIPASAILAAVRCADAFLALVAVLGVVKLASMIPPDRLRHGRLTVVAAAATLASQLAYFHIDRFGDDRVRLIQAVMVLAITAGCGALIANATAGARVVRGGLTVVALLAIVTIQFSYFSIDYFTRYRDGSNNLEPEGNARVVWEALLERARHRPLPAVYLAHVGPYGFSDLYWTFYATKHHREDLLARTTTDVEFRPDSIANLPDHSLAVTSPSPEADAAIDRLLASGVVRHKTLMTAANERSMYWILETGGARTASATH